MKKILVLGLAVLVLLVSLVGCSNENEEVNPLSNPAYDPQQALINPTYNNRLVLETYVATYVVVGDGEVSSTLILLNNNEFLLSGNEFISYQPSGTYRIENGKLLLTVTEDEVYVFLIGDGKLIFESGTWLEYLVEPGTHFLQPHIQ